MERRSTETRAVDLLLELEALARLAQEGPVRIGDTIFQKIFFWAEMRLRQMLVAAPDLRFVRYHWGPFSEELKEDVALLRQYGHMEPWNYRPTARGIEIAGHWRRLLEPKNQEAFSTIDKTAQELGRLTAAEVKALTYALPATQVGADPKKYSSLEDIPKGVALLLGRARDLKPFMISSDQLEDLIIDLQITAQDIRESREPGVAIRSAEDLERVIGEYKP